MPTLNLKAVHLGESQVAGFALKKDAKAFAHAHGWRSADVLKAANRFSLFWVIGQNIGSERLSLLRNDGSVFEIAYPGVF